MNTDNTDEEKAITYEMATPVIAEFEVQIARIAKKHGLIISKLEQSFEGPTTYSGNTISFSIELGYPKKK